MYSRGGMYNVDPCSLSLVNGILWGNANDQIRNDENANATVSYSIVQGGYSGTGNLNQDPLFVDAAGGNLRLQQCSPAINAGSNAALPQGTTTDLDEKPRIVHNTVDMGALEFQDNVPNQPDTDEDGMGDVCDTDDDGDGIADATDKCPLVASSNNADTDNDGLGDVCDTDDDGDGKADGSDNCPLVSNADQKDLDRDGTGDACDQVTNVSGAINALKTDVQALTVDIKWKNGLITKLNNAQAYCASGNISKATEELQGFINQVNSKRGKGISNAQANDLVARANALITAMRNGTSDCGGSSMVRQKASRNMQPEANVLSLRFAPNPSTTSFTLKVESSDKTLPLTLRIVDQYGRVVETRGKLSAGQNLQVGSSYRPGLYYAELLQGDNRQQVKLLKLSN